MKENKIFILVLIFLVGLCCSLIYRISTQPPRNYTIIQYSEDGKILNEYKVHKIYHRNNTICINDGTGLVILSGTIKITETK